jgi:hypothetical protein
MSLNNKNNVKLNNAKGLRGVADHMMALPKPKRLGDSKPTGGHAVVYFVPGLS